jgi:5,10-methylenetetrahydrofolate reductase
VSFQFNLRLFYVKGCRSSQSLTAADYIKIFIEDGTVVGASKMPATPISTMHAAVARAHHHGKMAIVHITTLDGAKQAIEAGVGGRNACGFAAG